MTAQMQPTNKAATVRPVTGRPPLPTQVSLTPKELLGILRRHVFLIVVLTILGAVIGTGSWYLLQKYYPSYMAVGAIQVLPPGDTDPLLIGSPTESKEIYDQSRNSKVRRMLSLGTLQKLLNKDKVRETTWYKRFVKDNNTDLAGAVKSLKKNLGVTAPRDDVHVLVSMTTRSAAESKLIANEMIRLFLAQQRDEATRSLTAQLGPLRDQEDKLKNDLAVSIDEMRKIRAGSPFGDISEANFRDTLTETVGNQQDDLSNLQNQIASLESVLGTLTTRAKGAFDEVTTQQIEQDPTARRMRDTIAMIEPRLAELLTRFGENHRRVKEVSSSLKQLQSDLNKRRNVYANIIRNANVRSVNDAFTAKSAELASQEKRLDKLKKDQKEMNKTRSTYLDVARQRDQRRERVAEITTHIKKLITLAGDPEISKVIMAWPAQLPLSMSKPRLLMYLPGGFILGLLIGLGLAFAIELLNDLVRSPSDVVKHLQAPLLGMICHIDEDPDVSSADLAHVVRRAPYSIMSECYRQFRANLKHSGRGEDKKVLLITSGAGGDGKTTIAANLATTLVAENCKVLLIDANFRRPMTVALFPRTDGSSAEPDWSLSSYLTGQCQADNGLLRPSGIEGFDIIDSGPVPASPAEMLGSAAMRDLLTRCRDIYDYIIIDSPPLLVSDAKTLAAQADGTILVFDAESTHRGAAQRALRELGEVNATVVGTVLMRVKAMKGGYFQEIYKSYQKYQQGASLQSVAS